MNRGEIIRDELTRSAIGAFFEVYNELGYGFLEHVCAKAMEVELVSRGHHVVRESSVRITYKGQHLCSQRLDLVVDDNLILETKASLELPKAAGRQLHNYLKATDIEVGLLLHFGPEPNDRKRREGQ
jgi:GxxExxY protein